MEIQSIVCTNNYSQACVRVEIDYPLPTIGNIATMKLTRTSLATGFVKTLIDKEVTNVSDLDVIYDDLEVLNGVSYLYIVYMATSDNIVERSGSATVTCSFEGLSIADATGSWKTAFGTSSSQYSESYKRNRQVQYVTTLSGKFPHRVSNSASNYTTGSISALWVPLGEACGEPTFPEETNKYREAFIEFLANGRDKLLRTADGKAYIVSIDGEITENWNPVVKLSTVTFNWTQIGEIDKPRYVSTGPAYVRPGVEDDIYDADEALRRIEELIASLDDRYVTQPQMEAYVAEAIAVHPPTLQE